MASLVPRAARCCRAYAAAPRVALKRATPSPLVRHHRAAPAPDPILLRTQSWVADTLPRGKPYHDTPYHNTPYHNTPYHKSLRADFGFDSVASPTPPPGYPPGSAQRGGGGGPDRLGRPSRANPAVVRTPQLCALEEHVRAGRAAQARPTPARNLVQRSLRPHAPRLQPYVPSHRPHAHNLQPRVRVLNLQPRAPRRRGSRASNW